jgi:Fe-S cluster assembly protein SufD
MPLPSEKEEVWRYSPIDALDLDAFSPSASGPVELGAEAVAVADRWMGDLPDVSAVVLVHNGTPVPGGGRAPRAPGLRIANASAGADHGFLGEVLAGGDALVRLNEAFFPDAVVVEVADGQVVEAPVLVVHWCDGADGEGSLAPASFPRTVVRVGRGSHVQVVEVVTGAPAAAKGLVVPVIELAVDDGGSLSYVSVQLLGTGAWHIGRIAATVGREATARTFTVGLGGAYDRSRTDATIVGQGGATELRSAYLGTGSQVHDVRTKQEHAAPHTTSDLLCKGAVAGSSRSVYSGLIRVRNGAVRSNAMQTNHNLVLSASAHADSVPNLDIAENDVRCSHASTVGPVDEDQLYYLESRGVPPEQAERLIVQGFFDDIVERSPVQAVVAPLRREVGMRLDGALGIGHFDATTSPGRHG